MQALFGLFTGGAGAAGATAATGAAATGAAAGAAGGLSLSQILSGGATVLSSVASIAAGNAQADAYKAQAEDAQAQKPLELLQGLQRKNEAKRAMIDAIGDINTSYAASNTDLTFGTPTVARQRAFQEADLAQTSNAMSTGATIDRLEQKRKNYLSMAGRARAAGLFEGLTSGLTGLSRLAQTQVPA